MRPRRGPSLLFAVTVIAGVALATAGAVAMFSDPSEEGAPETEQAAAIVPAPARTAEADAVAVAAMSASNLPVHKVVTKTIQPITASGMAAATEALGKSERFSAAEKTAAAEQDDELLQHDPRWARSASEKTATMFDSVLESSTPDDRNTTAKTEALALADESQSQAIDPSDGTETAAVAPEDLKPKQAAKPEKAKEAAVEEQEEDSPPGVSAATRDAQIIRAANMRSRPKSGSRVLGVVPKGASVQLVGCNGWCEIVYKGRRGYVYKDFIAGAGKVSSANAKPKTTFTVSTDKNTEQPKAAQPDKAADAKPAFKVISSRLQ